MPEHASIELKATPTAADDARHFATSTLHDWNFGQLADSVRLIVSELTTNALVHGAGETLTVTLSHAAPRLRVAVTDHGGGIPVPRIPRDDEESGRGLLIVGALSAAWGMVSESGGKTVWAEVPLAHALT
jgi:anti-sigma regulatory factor (Ser/Thr protein kinase)